MGGNSHGVGKEMNLCGKSVTCERDRGYYAVSGTNRGYEDALESSNGKRELYCFVKEIHTIKCAGG